MGEGRERKKKDGSGVNEEHERKEEEAVDWSSTFGAGLVMADAG